MAKAKAKVKTSRKSKVAKTRKLAMKFLDTVAPKTKKAVKKRAATKARVHKTLSKKRK